MRTIAVILSLALLALSAGVVHGNLQEEVPDYPETSFAGARRARLEALQTEIEGTWRLTRYTNLAGGVEQEFVRGVAIFANGDMALTIHAMLELSRTDARTFVAQSGVYHYRFSDTDRLQTAPMLAHSNFRGEELDELPARPFQYNVHLFEDTLTLRRPDGTTLDFRRSIGTRFPQQSADSLWRAEFYGDDPLDPSDDVEEDI